MESITFHYNIIYNPQVAGCEYNYIIYNPQVAGCEYNYIIYNPQVAGCEYNYIIYNPQVAGCEYNYIIYNPQVAGCEYNYIIYNPQVAGCEYNYIIYNPQVADDYLGLDVLSSQMDVNTSNFRRVPGLPVYGMSQPSREVSRSRDKTLIHVTMCPWHDVIMPV